MVGMLAHPLVGLSEYLLVVEKAERMDVKMVEMKAKKHSNKEK